MSADPSLVDGPELLGLIRQHIAEVLITPMERVTPDAALMADLGAESLDFLDLLFRLEESLGVPMPPKEWSRWLEARFRGQELRTALTPSTIKEFVTETLAG
jgi:acyl carrier protein